MLTLLLLACNDPKDTGATDTPTDTDAPTETDTDTDTPTVTDTVTTDTPCEPEVFGDGVDQACNGMADELGFGEPADAAAAATLTGDPSTQLYLLSLAVGTDADGVSWLASLGYDVGAAGVESSLLVAAAPLTGVWDAIAPGAALYTGVAVTDWSTPFVAVSEADFWPTRLEDGQLISTSAASVGTPSGPVAHDLDGDGVDELLVSVTGGRIDVFGAEQTWDAPRLRLEAPGSVALRVSGVGDVDGDGLPEIVAFEHGTDADRMWVVPGELTGTADVREVGWSITSPTDTLDALAMGDVTGDGVADLLLGAPAATSDGHPLAGMAYLVPGPITGDTTTDAAIATFHGVFDHDTCGNGVAILPDEDGDGRDEVAIGCSHNFDDYEAPLPGRVELYAGADCAGDLTAADARRVLVGGYALDTLGAVLRSAELTGDGLPDLAVLASGNDPTAGLIHVFAGPLL